MISVPERSEPERMSSEISLTLRPGEQLPLPTAEEGPSFFSLKTKHGVGRLATFSKIKRSDITLGFTGALHCEWLIAPREAQLSIEALTPLQMTVIATDSFCKEHELIRCWLWDLHHVRHPVGAMARLTALLQLMIIRFGNRISEGYTLPFSLSHSRLAEIIGVTRSTATRLLSVQRQQGWVQVNSQNGMYVVTPLMMDLTPKWMTELVDNA
jgi:hypothetical protein